MLQTTFMDLIPQHGGNLKLALTLRFHVILIGFIHDTMLLSTFQLLDQKYTK
jgi:hypothetical protein